MEFEGDCHDQSVDWSRNDIVMSMICCKIDTERNQDA